MNNSEVKSEVTARDIWLAKKRISPYVTRTPLIYSHALSELTKASVYLKLENLQEIGAFKVRGAANKLLSLTEEEKAKGVTTFSTGNHGMAVAYMANRLGIEATICMSTHVPQVKINAIKRWNPTIRQIGDNQDDAERLCNQLVAEKGVTLVKPFDDAEIIAGQGTIALEILEDLPDVDTAIVPLSGGGLISGVALGLKSVDPSIKVVGVSMEKSAVMIESLKAGHPVEMQEEPTLADSLLGGIGIDNKYTFNMVKKYVSETAQVSENEIAKGIAFTLAQHRLLIEGASATGVAYAMKEGMIKPGSKVAIVVSGNGIDLSCLKDILSNKYGEI